MRQINNVVCGDDYTDAATLSNVISSNGGYFTIQGADVFVELQYGLHGQTVFTEETHVPIGGGIILPKTTGIRFRNYQAGKVATVTASISENQEPTIQIAATGQSSVNSGTGAMQLVQDQILTIAAPVIEFAAIPSDGIGLYLQYYLRGDKAAATCNTFLRVNNDSGPSYNYQTLRVNNAVVTALGSGGTTALGIYLGESPANGANVGSYGGGTIEIPNYSDNGHFKPVVSKSYALDAAGNADNWHNSGGGLYFGSVVPINDLIIRPDSGNWIAGSRATLWKLTT